MKLIFKLFSGTFRAYNRKRIWLGTLCYDNDWKCWGWIQEPNVQMSASCLEEIIDKTKELDRIKERSDKK